jgi:hypothetical protein
VILCGERRPGDWVALLPSGRKVSVSPEWARFVKHGKPPKGVKVAPARKKKVKKVKKKAARARKAPARARKVPARSRKAPARSRKKAAKKAPVARWRSGQKVSVATTTGEKQKTGSVLGYWAVHKSVKGGGYTLTHTATGLLLAQGPEAKLKKAAKKINALTDWGDQKLFEVAIRTKKEKGGRPGGRQPGWFKELGQAANEILAAELG